MESAKPIEAGCKAMIITADPRRSEFSGKVVKVIKFIGCIEISGVDVPNFWEINPINFCIPKNLRPMAPEKNLMRIDDDELQQQIESEQVTNA